MMFLNDVQKKARKEFCQNFIDSNYSKMIFTDECVFKGGKQRSRKWCSDQESYWEIWMCYPREALQPLAESLAFKNIRLILF